eukprot:augustus_masked-scaffold_25-processed-gene-3.56-mRNA-1 protein AED:0.71 eAED:0.71 QI:0/-1/0/1/-1/1/1/0/113
MYKDLANHPQKEEYDKAIQKELQQMHSRNVLSIVKRSEINTNDEVGKLIFVLTGKRSSLTNARLVFNGCHQKYKLQADYSSPTLHLDSLTTALTLAAQQQFSFRTADVEAAFL